MTIGADDWPFRIPLVRDPDEWRFDVAAGNGELLNRRVGLNKLFTIAVMKAYVDARLEYARADGNDDGVQDFAQEILSSEGTRDGLYRPTENGEPESRMGPLIAEAVAEGYKASGGNAPKPYHGSLYRVLKVQGGHAPGGARGSMSRIDT